MLNKQFKQIENSWNNSNYRESSNVRISNTNYSTKVAYPSDYALNLEQIIDALEIQFLEAYDQPMMAVEILLLEGIWQNKTYSEVAVENHYSPTYLTNVAAPKLLKKLSQLAKYRITKKNCRSKLAKCILENMPSWICRLWSGKENRQTKLK